MTTRSLFVACALSLSLLLPAIAHAYEPRHVFITNRGGGNVVELNDTFTYQRTWFDGVAFERLELSAPNGMAFTPDGSLFVADTFNQRIVAFDGSGNFVRSFATLTRLGMAVESIYFDGSGVLFASANPGLGVVARYSQTGMDRPNVVSGPAFMSLGNVNLTAAGNVIVSDFSGMGRGLRELDPATGAVLRTFGADLSFQEDVMIDGGDRVFVSHLGGDEVVVFGPAPARAELFRFRAPATAELPLLRPTGIALTYDCAILVASFTNGGIFVFRHEGDTAPTFERVLRPGVEIPADAMLSDVESIAISALGLPGSFVEFVDRVPSCDEPPPVDAGVASDAGSSAATDAGTIADAGTSGSDGGRRVLPAADDGCGCRAGGEAPRSGVWLVLSAIVLVVSWRRRSRRR